MPRADGIWRGHAMGPGRGQAGALRTGRGAPEPQRRLCVSCRPSQRHNASVPALGNPPAAAQIPVCCPGSAKRQSGRPIDARCDPRAELIAMVRLVRFEEARDQEGSGAGSGRGRDAGGRGRCLVVLLLYAAAGGGGGGSRHSRRGGRAGRDRAGPCRTDPAPVDRRGLAALQRIGHSPARGGGPHRRDQLQ